MDELTGFSNEPSYRRFLAIADKIERDPALLAIPLDNIARWLAHPEPLAPHRRKQWREIILAAQATPEGMTALLELLRDDSEEARHLKSFSPFAGVLTREERDRFACAYTH